MPAIDMNLLQQLLSSHLMSKRTADEDELSRLLGPLASSVAGSPAVNGLITDGNPFSNLVGGGGGLASMLLGAVPPNSGRVAAQRQPYRPVSGGYSRGYTPHPFAGVNMSPEFVTMLSKRRAIKESQMAPDFFKQRKSPSGT